MPYPRPISLGALLCPPKNRRYELDGRACVRAIDPESACTGAALGIGGHVPWKELLFGLLLTFLALGVWLVTALFELSPSDGLIAVVAGVVLGLARDRSPLSRYGAFLIGLAFGLLALVFGMAGWIGWVIAVVILTVISALTRGNLPLWAMLLGGGTLAAIYEPALMANPWFVLTQFPTALLVALAGSAGGFLVTILVELLEDRRNVNAERDDDRTNRNQTANESVLACGPTLVLDVEPGAGPTGEK